MHKEHVVLNQLPRLAITGQPLEVKQRRALAGGDAIEAGWSFLEFWCGLDWMKERLAIGDWMAPRKDFYESDEYLQKGKLVFVEGRLNYHTWEDDEGKQWSKLEVYAFSVQFL